MERVLGLGGIFLRAQDPRAETSHDSDACNYYASLGIVVKSCREI